MGQELYEEFPAARALYEQADALLDYPLSTLCFEGPPETLTDTVHQQPALYVTSLATLTAMESAGWHSPHYVAGHSLGELSALAAAGSLSFAAGLALVQRRGELMKAAGEAHPGAMAAVLALDVPAVAVICQEAGEQTGQIVQVANDNCPGQVVISGDEVALDRAMALALERGARKVVKLAITIAAHSPLMAAAAEAFAAVVEDTPIDVPRLPVIANVTAQPLYTPDEIRAELKAQLTAAVAWTDSISYLSGQGVGTYVEVGPGDVLLGLVRRIDRKATRLKFQPSVNSGKSL